MFNLVDTKKSSENYQLHKKCYYNYPTEKIDINSSSEKIITYLERKREYYKCIDKQRDIMKNYGK